MEKYPITGRSLEKYFHIDGDQFERQYKEHLSDYMSWPEKDHALEWLLFPDNLGPYLSIDETSLSNGELYTIVTNKEAHGGKGSMVAIVKGTRSEDVIDVLEKIPEEQLRAVKEVTLDLSDSMRKIVRRCFTAAIRVIDRFHVQKLACDAVQEIRVGHRWEAIQEDTDAREEAKGMRQKHEPFRFKNGDTRKELLVRSRYLLFKSAEKWSKSQKERAGILFKEYPDIKRAYGLSHSLRMIFNKRSIKAGARMNLARWYMEVEESGFDSCNTIAATIYEHNDEILNFYERRSTNAAAESFNAKIKLFRAQLRGVVDIKFFLFRLAKLYA